MSVINKMLRDLDARSHPAADGALPRPVPLPAVPTPQDPSRNRPSSLGMPALVGLLLIAVLGAAVWWWSRGGDPSARLAAQPSKPALQVAQSAQAPAVAPTADALLPDTVPKPQVAPAAAAESQSKSKPLVPPAKLAAGPKHVPPQGKVVAQEVSKAVAPLAVPGAVAASHAVPAAAVATSASADAAAPNRQQQGVREALAQAQALWGAGSHDAAIDLLQQALNLMERSGSSLTGTAQLAALARELGRMLVAQGRSGAALDTLTRLEPQLSKEADIWALRGNAAQRLGRHQESILAYATALQLRPNEQRWMLASAVSMAALGQLANASDMAARASALGPVSKEVQAYLRQAGVRLGEP